jgi:hypothetical protein
MVCRSSKEAKAIYYAVCDLIPDRYKPFVDPAVYKSLQQFRLYGSHKWESERVKIFRPDLCTWKPSVTPIDDNHLEVLRFCAFLINNTSGCSYLTSLVVEEPTTSLCDDMDELQTEEVKEVMKIFRSRYKYHAAFNYLRHTSRFIILKRISQSYCEICERYHEHENPYLFIIGEKRQIYFDCRRSNGEKSKIYIGSLGVEITSPVNETTSYKVIKDITPTRQSVMGGLVVSLKHSSLCDLSPAKDKILTDIDDVCENKSDVHRDVDLSVEAYLPSSDEESSPKIISPEVTEPSLSVKELEIPKGTIDCLISSNSKIIAHTVEKSRKYNKKIDGSTKDPSLYKPVVPNRRRTKKGNKE